MDTLAIKAVHTTASADAVDAVRRLIFTFVDPVTPIWDRCEARIALTALVRNRWKDIQYEPLHDSADRSVFPLQKAYERGQLGPAIAHFLQIAGVAP